MLALLIGTAALVSLGRQAVLTPSDSLTAKTFIAEGHSAGATGDGVTDDWDSLQKAIFEAIRRHKSLLIEPGIYHISKTLVINDPLRAVDCGFMIRGEAGPNRSGNRTNGVSIVLDAKSTTDQAVLAVGHAPFRDLVIENLGLISRVPNNRTPYGLLFAGNTFSHATIRNVTASFVHTAFATVPGGSTEGNGEEVDLDQCLGCAVNCFSANSSGQAYCHKAVNCAASIYNGGVAFKIGGNHLGFSFDSFAFTSSFFPGPLQNTFFENDGVSGNINFSGGREEDVDTLIAYGGGSLGAQAIISLGGMHFTIFHGHFPLIDATLNHYANAQWTNSFQNCRLDGDRATIPKLYVKSQPGDLSLSIFDRCVFTGFGNLITELAGMRIKARDCRATLGKSALLHDVNN